MLVLAISVVAVTVCARFNVSEALLRWSQPLERFQLDELPAILLVIAACMAWFAARRYREACRELSQRQRAEQELRRALSANRRLARQYLEIQEAERRALARDLHDELGQHLNAMKIDAVARARPTAARSRRRPRRPPRRLSASSIACRPWWSASSASCGRWVWTSSGLAAALEHCVAEWRRRLPRTRARAVGRRAARGARRDAAPGAVSPGAGGPHQRCAPLAGDARRDPASAASRTRTATGAAIVAAIEDDGVGMDPAGTGLGLGLVGMRERVEAVGGSLQVQRSGAGGFALRALIPLGTAA